MSEPVDPITREIIANALASAAREMGVTMRQTSTSPIFNEGNDYSCAIFNADARIVSHGEFLPIHLGSLPYSVRLTIEEIRPEHDHAAACAPLRGAGRGTPSASQRTSNSPANPSRLRCAAPPSEIFPWARCAQIRLCEV